MTRPSTQLMAVLVLLIGGSVGCKRPTSPQLQYNASVAAEIQTALSAGVEAGGGAGGGGLGTPTGFATLYGKFTLNGNPLPLVQLNIDKDVEVCAPASEIGTQALVVGEGGGIQNILIFVTTKLPADDPAWEHESYAASKTGEVLYDQKNCVFLSHVQGMRSTQQLKILNSDSVGHNTNLAPTRGSRQFNQTVAANASLIYEPGAASPNPFPVSCSIHPWMQAHLMVFDHPYFAVTAADGSFEIANVPAGVELEYRVWQETSGYLVDVTAETAPWKKGRFSLQLEPDERREMNVTVNAAAFQ